MTAADGSPDAVGPDPVDPVDPAERRVVPEVLSGPPPPGVLDLVVRGTRLGFDAAGLLAAEVAGAGVRLARAVLPPVVAGGPVQALDDAVARTRAVARDREAARRDEVTEAVRGVVGRVVDLVVEQIDFAAVVARVPVDEIVDQVDVDAIVARLDIGAIAEEALDAIDITAIVRESTTGLAGETLDVVRAQAMIGDVVVTGLVDRLLGRREPRDVSFPAYGAARTVPAAGGGPR